MTERSIKPHGHANAASVPAHGPQKNPSKYDSNPSGIVMGLTLSLSWQLAIVVLVPILGGNFIDKSLKTSPWFTVAGFAMAMTLMIVVLRRTLKQLNEYMKNPNEQAENTKETSKK